MIFRQPEFLAFATLISLGGEAFSSSGCHVDNLTVTEVTSRSANLSWSADGCQTSGDQGFILRWKLQSILACNRYLLSNVNFSNQLMEKNVYGDGIFLTELKPFSRYEVNITAIGDNEEHSVSVETRASSPETVPSPAHTIQSASFAQSIRFFWSPSDPSLCHLQHGRPDGYRVELWGVDAWVVSNQPVAVENVPENVFQYFAQHLLPFTRYRLRIFNRNQGNRFNHTNALEIEDSTLPAVPKTPEKTEAIVTSPTSVQLRWVPHYPPNGLIDKYVVRQGTISASGMFIWSKMYVASPNDDFCHGVTIDSKPFSDPFCYQISGLEPATDYTFQVKVYNVNVTVGSDFSEEVVAKTLRPEVTSEPVLRAPTSENEGTSRNDDYVKENGSGSAIAGFVSLAVLVILSCVACILVRHKIKVTAEKLVSWSANTFGGRHEQLVEMSLDQSGAQNHQDASPNAYGDLQSSAVHQIAEIQRRRLPEPPPEPPVFAWGCYSDKVTRRMEGDRENSKKASESRISDSSSSDGNKFSDAEGYLCPTFDMCTDRTAAVPISPGKAQEDETHEIPAESYQSSLELANGENKYVTDISGTKRNVEHHPLIYVANEDRQ